MNKKEDQFIDPSFLKQLENEFMFSELQQLDKMLDQVSYYCKDKTQNSQEEKL